MKAEEFFNEWKEEQDFGKLSQTFNKGYLLNEQTLFEFAEAYLQHRVNEINIENECWGDNLPYRKDGMKWFKNKILKQ